MSVWKEKEGWRWFESASASRPTFSSYVVSFSLLSSLSIVYSFVYILRAAGSSGMYALLPLSLQRARKQIEDLSNGKRVRYSRSSTAKLSRLRFWFSVDISAILCFPGKVSRDAF